jgi:hypothetical protein
MAIVFVALGGLGGLVATFGSTHLSHRARTHRVRTVAQLGLFGLLFSLLPILPAALGASQGLTWRLSAAGLGIGLAGLLAALALDLRGLIRDRVLPVRSLPRWLTALLFGPPGLLVLALLVAALGPWSRAARGVYLAAMFYTLIACAFSFLAVVLAAKRQTGPPPG